MGRTYIERLYCVLMMFLRFASSHDMCLDGFFPKDRSTELTVNICEKYKSNGCCDNEALQKILDQYTRDVKTDKIPKKCQDIFLEILCQKCSPRSAHLFEGETKENRKYPLLCQNFCKKIDDNCAEYVVSVFEQELCDEKATTEKMTDCYPKTDEHDDHEEKTEVTDDNCIPVCLRKLMDGVSNIVDSAFPPDNSNRLFAVQQYGIIWEFTAERKKLPEPFLNMQYKVQQSSGGDERGLLSMVFDPDFLKNKYFYLFYNPPDGGIRSRIVRMKISDAGSPMKIEEGSEKVILEYPKPEGNHNGGQLFFGNDGFLYITTGDGGGGGDKHGSFGNGQSLTSYLGKILRIDVKSDPANPYSIPDDNPFAKSDSEQKKEIFAYGLRNPWRTSIDKKTGTIFCGDVGQNHIEEIDIIINGGNYGWRAYEGNDCYDSEMCEKIKKSGDKLEWPIYTYTHDVGKAVIGGYVYRGNNIPQLKGKYVFGDQKFSQLWALEKNGDKWIKRDVCVGKTKCPEETNSKNFRNMFAFGQDEKGELYIFSADSTKMSEPNGAMHQIVPPNE